MDIEEYKNTLNKEIEMLEADLTKVNDRIIEFGLKSQKLSAEDFSNLWQEMIGSYGGPNQTAYQVRSRLVNKIALKTLEALPADKKYFIRVVNDTGAYAPHTETFKCVKEINPNVMKVIRLDHYLEAKKDPENENSIIEDYAKFIKRSAGGTFYLARWRNSIFFISDSPNAYYDYRFK